jgi:hypothetical protein
MLVQNEVSAERFNRFADIIDLDRLARQEYTPEIIAEMSENLANAINQYGENIPAKPIGKEGAARLLERARLGKIALPRQVAAATTQGLPEGERLMWEEIV